MKKKLGMMFCYTLLTACAQQPYVNSCCTPMCPEKYARCAELKRLIVFNSATTDSLVAAQRNGELDKLNRQFQLEGC